MSRSIRFGFCTVLVGSMAFAGCSSSSSSGGSGPQTDAQYSQTVTDGMQTSLQSDLNDMIQAAKDLQAAAPSKPWDNTDPAVATMQEAWIRARHAYEHVEGATAPIFPDIDTSIDGRVEDFAPGSGSGVLSTTCNMFGDQCMTGLHAVERILWSNVTPATVSKYEADLGYVPVAAFPKTQQEADDFKNKLCAKIIADATALQAGWQPAKIDIGSAFQGLISLMNEQKEKVTKAGLHQEESRYSQRTMDDLRYNLAGTSKIYTLFQPWVKSKANGADIDSQILAGFQTLDALYASDPYKGAAFPAPPADWSDTMPSADDLKTPFGQLYSAVNGAVDPAKADSVVSQMNKAATVCGLPQFNGG